MSFNINFFLNQSEENAVSKTLSNVTTLTGTLKNETSIVDPVILIQADISVLTTCNYMSIPIFGRYYFIKDVKSIRTSLIEVYGHVDVLQTYWNYIKLNYAVIRRQRNLWNEYINDDAIHLYNNPIVITREFPNGLDNDTYVFITAGHT